MDDLALLTSDERAAIEHAAVHVLDALKTVADAARVRLREGGHDEAAFHRHARKHLSLLQAQRLQALQETLSEPFIARVVVQWDDIEHPTTYLISRTASVAGLDRAVDAKIASSVGSMGRVAERPVGSRVVIELKEDERGGTIVERLIFDPRRGEDWDALLRYPVVLADGRRLDRDTIRALLTDLRTEVRRSISELGNEDAVDLFGDTAPTRLATPARRRRVIERMSLRDQAILDHLQGDVFRRSLDQRLVLLGPPGTGKTTTLIKRIAQKRLLSELPDEECQLLSELEVESLTWRMYSPSDLLAIYLSRAFGKEHVPVTPWNVTTWAQVRTEISRNIFAIVKSATGGRFRVGSIRTIKTVSSRQLRELYDGVAMEVDAAIVDRSVKALDDARALRNMSSEDRRQLNQLGARVDIESVLRFGSTDSTLLSAGVRRLDMEHRRLRDASTQHLTRSDREHLLMRLVAVVEAHAREPVDDSDDDDENPDTPGSDAQAKARTLFSRALNHRAREIALGRRPSRSAIVAAALEAIGGALPSTERLQALGETLVLRRTYETLRSAARGLVRDVPRIYAAYRRRVAKEGRVFAPVVSSDSDYLKGDLISTDELDVLVLISLRNARRITDRRVFGAEDYRSVEPFRVAQVYVDEVTDFSPVELACMMELSNHTLRSFFACGDFSQRVTERGISSFEEFEWVSRVTSSPGFEECEISRHYRQSPQLVELARGLSALQAGARDATGSSAFEEAGQVERAEDGGSHAGPLLVEHVATLDDTAAWLCERILEVEREVGKQVSIAIFVDGEEAAAELAKHTQPLLDEHNLRVQHCKDGRDAGYESEVRVFDVQHIKGLEFEAVFLVGVDRLAERLPSLFDRFLYVGVTRAATYLGITCEGALPERLEPVRGHFATGGW